jgi:hypothetical protein
MGWVDRIIDVLVPELGKSLRSGISAFCSAKRKERHLFVLKAMTTQPNRLMAPEPGSVRYDLGTIDQRLYIAQMTEALGDVPLFRDEIPPERKKAYTAALKRQRKLGLPGARDPERSRQLEQILQEMVDDHLLAFHPPNMWVVR